MNTSMIWVRNVDKMSSSTVRCNSTYPWIVSFCVWKRLFIICNVRLFSKKWQRWPCILHGCRAGASTERTSKSIGKSVPEYSVFSIFLFIILGNTSTWVVLSPAPHAWYVWDRGTQKFLFQDLFRPWSHGTYSRRAVHVWKNSHTFGIHLDLAQKYGNISQTILANISDS